MPTRKRKRTSNAVDILYNEFYKGKPERIAALHKEYLSSRIASAIYELRTGAGMTQAELAKRLGTKASAISRLESADYDGHSLAILGKLATLFSGKLEIRIIPVKKTQKYLKSPKTGQDLEHFRQVIA